jgi:hypothetical protein
VSSPPVPPPEQWHPDLTKAPKTEQLVPWLTKLDKWCRAAVREIDDLKTHSAELSSECERLERACQEFGLDEFTLDSLQEKIRDFSRGLVTAEELLDEVGGLYPHDKPPA